MQWLLRGIYDGVNTHNLTYPDTVFIFNAYDTPVCSKVPNGCPVPVFSMHKRFRLGRAVEADLLLPHFGRVWERIISFPWEMKDPRALLRASMQVSLGNDNVTLIILIYRFGNLQILLSNNIPFLFHFFSFVGGMGFIPERL